MTKRRVTNSKGRVWGVQLEKDKSPKRKKGLD